MAQRQRFHASHVAWMAMCFWLAAASGAVAACDVAPHLSSEMPGSLSNHWFGDGGSLAWFDGPTTRYPHGVLGDTVEATRLHAYSDTAQGDCGDQSITLTDDLVFEDTAPRLVDLDGDGLPEIIVVQSHQRFGAQLAVYRVSDDGIGIDLLATTPLIGRSNRWLAPVGTADLDGDGTMEIGYIDRPHLARTLRVWRVVPSEPRGQVRLEEIATQEGLTNHRIGEDFISGGIRLCGTGPELVTANADWTRVMVIRLEAGGLHARAIAPWSPETLAQVMTCAL